MGSLLGLADSCRAVVSVLMFVSDGSYRSGASKPPLLKGIDQQAEPADEGDDGGHPRLVGYRAVDEEKAEAAEDQDWQWVGGDTVGAREGWFFTSEDDQA
jgi:hypothetical protein